MRQKIDVAGLVREARDILPDSVDGYPPDKDGLLLAALVQPTNLDEALADLAEDAPPKA